MANCSKRASAQGQIQPARLQQRHALSRLAYRSKALWGYGQPFLDQCLAELSVTRQAITQGDIYLALDRAGCYVGFYGLEMLSAREIELSHLFVEPVRLRQGLGTHLLQHAKAQARARGYARLMIQGEPCASGFYLASGARLIGQRPSGSIAGRQLPWFELTLDP